MNADSEDAIQLFNILNDTDKETLIKIKALHLTLFLDEECERFFRIISNTCKDKDMRNLALSCMDIANITHFKRNLSDCNDHQQQMLRTWFNLFLQTYTDAMNLTNKFSTSDHRYKYKLMLRSKNHIRITGCLKYYFVLEILAMEYGYCPASMAINDLLSNHRRSKYIHRSLCCSILSYSDMYYFGFERFINNTLEFNKNYKNLDEKNSRDYVISVGNDMERLKMI
ncbi:hypothetical protein DP163_gp034 [Sea otter poxvirus]|uniref:Uncharacterized protein n=1 Tax=Sea otter poxvirus TaxID=1416741 RepID=A0A2U9QHK4_9POXV|nr:hypothetical protein DP163_gp034 [Sea otter poxvirus]AWU47079.1 hypothetical protein [Sea otter poxvirus]